MTEKKTDAKEPSFEEALARLEAIVEEMEQGQLDLEKMTGRFDEGTRLIRFCNQRLNEVERKIEVLVERNQELQTKPLDAGEDAEDA